MTSCEYKDFLVCGQLDVVTSYELHRCFATDLFFLLSSVCEIGWHPCGFPSYEIPPTSPLRPALHLAAMHLILGRDAAYVKYHKEFLQDDPQKTVDGFKAFTRNLLTDLVKIDRDSEKIFFTFVYITRLSFEFYKQGTHDIQQFVCTHVSIALSTLLQIHRCGVPDLFTEVVDNVKSQLQKIIN